MTDEEWMAANPGVGSCDAPGTYTGDRIEELEDEIKRLANQVIALMDEEKDTEIKRLREIEEAARAYREIVRSGTNSLILFVERIPSSAAFADSHNKAGKMLDTLLGKGEAK